MWEQLATDQTDPWQAVPRQVFSAYDCLLISVAFVVLCRGGCLWVTGMIIGIHENGPRHGKKLPTHMLDQKRIGPV